MNEKAINSCKNGSCCGHALLMSEILPGVCKVFMALQAFPRLSPVVAFPSRATAFTHRHILNDIT